MTHALTDNTLCRWIARGITSVIIAGCIPLTGALVMGATQAEKPTKKVAKRSTPTPCIVKSDGAKPSPLQKKLELIDKHLTAVEKRLNIKPMEEEANAGRTTDASTAESR